MQQGQFPMWDPHNWAGQSMIGQAQPGAAYPLNWLLWMMPRKDGHIQIVSLQWYFVLIHYMGGLFCFWLCRDLGRSRGASLFAALIFALAGYLGSTDWPQMLNGAVWAPLVFLFLLRAARGVRPVASAALCGASLGMAWLSGHHQVPIFLMLASTGVWLTFIFEGGRLNFRMARLALLSVIFAVTVGALQILPAQEYGRLALRWVGAADPVGWKDSVPYYAHRDHELNPISLFAIVFPGLNTNSNPFIGVAAVALGLLGAGLAWKERAVRIFTGLAICSIFYALGAHSLFNGILYAALPWVEKARVPAMATVIFSIAAAVLAAYGTDAMRLQGDHGWVRRIIQSVSAFAAVTGGGVLAVLFAKRLSWDVDDRVMMTVLVGLLLAVLLYAWRVRNISHTQAVTLAVLLLLLDIGNEAGYRLGDRNQFDKRTFLLQNTGHSEIAAFLLKQPGPFRVESNTDAILPNWGDYYNLDFIKAYAGATTNSLEMEMHLWETRMLLGTRYSISNAPEKPTQREVFEGSGGLKVFENSEAFPRTWAVHELYRITTVQQGQEAVWKDLPALRRKAFLSRQAPSLPACPAAPDLTRVTGYQPSRVEVHAEMACDGMLVLSDTYFPGWIATVDGRRAEIYEVDLSLRGVLVPKGRHEIVFRYRPRSVMLGALLTCSGLAAAAALAFASRR